MKSNVLRISVSLCLLFTIFFVSYCSSDKGNGDDSITGPAIYIYDVILGYDPQLELSGLVFSISDNSDRISPEGITDFLPEGRCTVLRYAKDEVTSDWTILALTKRGVLPPGKVLRLRLAKPLDAQVKVLNACDSDGSLISVSEVEVTIYEAI